MKRKILFNKPDFTFNYNWFQNLMIEIYQRAFDKLCDVCFKKFDAVNS
jgi:hypothetical protein